jgi:hypothetical protein
VFANPLCRQGSRSRCSPIPRLPGSGESLKITSRPLSVELRSGKLLGCRCELATELHGNRRNCTARERNSTTLGRHASAVECLPQARGTIERARRADRKILERSATPLRSKRGPRGMVNMPHVRSVSGTAGCSCLRRRCSAPYVEAGVGPSLSAWRAGIPDGAYSIQSLSPS